MSPVPFGGLVLVVAGSGDAVSGHQLFPAVGTAVQADIGHRASLVFGTLLPLTPTLFSVDVVTCLSSRKLPSRNLCTWLKPSDLV